MHTLAFLAAGSSIISSSFRSLLLATFVLDTGLTGRLFSWFGVVGRESPGLELALEGMDELGGGLKPGLSRLELDTAGLVNLDEGCEVE